MSNICIKKDSGSGRVYPLYVVKNGGKVEPFSEERIYERIYRYALETGERRTSQFSRLASKATQLIIEESNYSEIVPTALITKCVQEVCTAEKHLLIAKTFINYRQQSKFNSLKEDEQILNNELTVKETTKDILRQTSRKVMERYWLEEVYNEEFVKLHQNSDVYLHGVDSIGPQEIKIDLGVILNNNFGNSNTGIAFNSPTCLSSALNHILNVCRSLQSELFGIQTLTSFSTYLSPYVRKDKLDEDDVFQALQSFIYSHNIEYGGIEKLRTALGVDSICPDALKNKVPVVSGKTMSFRYGELEYESNLITKSLVKVLNGGDANGNKFSSPAIMFSFNDNCISRSKPFTMLCDYAIKANNVLFERPSAKQLQLESSITGSIDSVSVNCARLGYIYQEDKKGLINWIDDILDVVGRAFNEKRRALEENILSGAYPYLSNYIKTFENFSGVIYFQGINEMIRNYSQDMFDITSRKGNELCIELLSHAKKRLHTISKINGFKIELQSNYDDLSREVFAKEDSSFIDDIIHAGVDSRPNYTSSSDLPAGFTDNPFEEIELQKEIREYYSEQSVYRVLVDGVSLSGSALQELLEVIFTNNDISRLVVTPCYSMCPVHGYTASATSNCLICDRKLLRINTKPTPDVGGFETLLSSDGGIIDSSLIKRDIESELKRRSSDNLSESTKIVPKRRRTDFSSQI